MCLKYYTTLTLEIGTKGNLFVSLGLNLNRQLFEIGQYVRMLRV